MLMTPVFLFIMQLLWLWPFNYWYVKKGCEQAFSLSVRLAFVALGLSWLGRVLVRCVFYGVSISFPNMNISTALGLLLIALPAFYILLCSLIPYVQRLVATRYYGVFLPKLFLLSSFLNILFLLLLAMIASACGAYPQTVIFFFV